MTNFETKNIDVSFYLDGDLSYFNSDLNSKIKTKDNQINLPYSLDINDGNLYLLSNNFNNDHLLENCTIYKQN